MAVRLYHGDCLDILPTLPAESVHAVITDPPYLLNFMSKTWDRPNSELHHRWAAEAYRVILPGAYLLAFGGTRTFHRMACAIEDAGFEIRDTIMWVFGSGFPKSLDVAKAIDKVARGVPQGAADPTSINHGRYKGGCSDDNPTGRGFGAGPGAYMAEGGSKEQRTYVAEAEAWRGFGTALKPSYEPIILARKPLSGTVVDNVLKHRTGGLNIDASRIPINSDIDDPRLGGKGSWSTAGMAKNVYGEWAGIDNASSELGRFPSNLIHDGSEEVEDAFAAYGKKTSGVPGTRRKAHETHSMSGRLNLTNETEVGYADIGSASRFFKSCTWNEQDANRIAYFAKAAKKDRAGSTHPTVKPLSLMAYLCKLITPPGGTILDCFAGSGTTGQAAVESGFNDVILIEREAEYFEHIRRRLSLFIE